MIPTPRPALPRASPSDRPQQRLAVLTCRLQGGYYVATGLWPLIAPGSFQWVTGPKVDLWLAQTVGGLLAVCGWVLLQASRRGGDEPGTPLLGAGLALVLGVVDILCITQPRTTFAYLADAPVEFAVAACWWVVVRRRSQARRQQSAD